MIKSIVTNYYVNPDGFPRKLEGPQQSDSL